MKVYQAFPGGKAKALTMSYDDGKLADERLLEIFNRYGIKGTFNLNYGLMDMDIRLKPEQIPRLYQGHEIATHTMTHPTIARCPLAQAAKEILEDRQGLERITGGLVRGHAYPNGSYNEEIKDLFHKLGIAYARVVEETENFDLPVDPMEWHPTCHHNKVTDALIEDFLNPPLYRNLALFYIWGHSYEFERQNNWEHIRHICEALKGREDVWYATNLEIYEYVTAMRSLVMSADGKMLYNPTAIPIYLMIGYTKACIPAGMCLNLHGQG